jgi:hypothetical protein
MDVTNKSEFYNHSTKFVLYSMCAYGVQRGFIIWIRYILLATFTRVAAMIPQQKYNKKDKLSWMWVILLLVYQAGRMGLKQNFPHIIEFVSL